MKNEKHLLRKIIYCPKCVGYCGEMYCGVLYNSSAVANLEHKCPHCKADISKIIKKNENF